jgi:hypothetical protein
MRLRMARPFGSMANLRMKMRTVLAIGSLLLLASGVLLWRLVLEHQRANNLVAHFDRRMNQLVDFVVYRAYKDAASDIREGVLHFSSRDGWERSFEIGSLKVVAECVPSPEEALRASGAILATPLAPKPKPSRDTVIDWHSLYNSHKSRAAFRQLQQGTNPASASELLDGLESARILTHELRLGIESQNILDPY